MKMQISKEGVTMMIFQETEKVELKRILNDTLPKEIVAFLNSFDGTIYIGVEDDGTVIGVNNLDETPVSYTHLTLPTRDQV